METDVEQPWGLSGPQFLGVYAVALLVSLAVVAVMRNRLRVGPFTDRGPVDVYTLAAVAGGGKRVVDTAVYAMIEGGHLRASRDHKLTVCGGVPGEPVQRAVLGAFGKSESATLPELRRPAVTSHEVRQASAVAVDRGFLLAPDRRRAVRLTTLLPLAVFGVGVARLVNGVRLGRPVGLLVLELLVTVPLLIAAANPHRRTRSGGELLRRARRNRTARDEPQVLDVYSPTGALLSAGVLGVAALGAAGVTDASLRSSLYGSTAASSTDAGAGCGGSGGGCGSGGCGGGCGG